MGLFTSLCGVPSAACPRAAVSRPPGVRRAVAPFWALIFDFEVAFGRFSPI